MCSLNRDFSFATSVFMYDYCVWKTHYASLKNTHAHSFHTNCSRPKHCKLARHFSLTTKPTEPSERNTRERELPASVCVRVCEVRALSVEFHVEAAVRLRRSRGGEQRGRKTTSLFFFFSLPSIFPHAHFFPPLLNSGRFIRSTMAATFLTV